MTVTDAVALKEPLVAVIVASPFATAVTAPLVTVAIAASLDAQVTVGPDMAAPVWSFTVAVRVVASPSDESVTDELDKVIEVATGITGCVGVVPPPGGSPPHETVPISKTGIRRRAFMSDLHQRVTCQ